MGILAPSPGQALRYFQGPVCELARGPSPALRFPRSHPWERQTVTHPERSKRLPLSSFLPVGAGLGFVVVVCRTDKRRSVVLSFGFHWPGRLGSCPPCALLSEAARSAGSPRKLGFLCPPTIGWRPALRSGELFVHVLALQLTGLSI